MRIKGGLTSAIYRKSLKLANEGRASKATGDIVNYMAVDAQRLQDLTQFAQQLWSAPFQICICMFSLYKLVGWSMLAGIGVMIVMIPVNGFIARIMKNLQKQQMKNKDARSRLIAEIINNMKSIKLYAWGAAFMNKLNFIRNDMELKNLRKIGAGQAIANFTWSTTPFLVSCLTFTVFVLTRDDPLPTEIVFPALGKDSQHVSTHYCGIAEKLADYVSPKLFSTFSRSLSPSSPWLSRRSSKLALRLDG